MAVQLLGTFTIRAGEDDSLSQLLVTLSNNADGLVIADGVMIRRTSASFPKLQYLDLRQNPLNNDAYGMLLPQLEGTINRPTSTEDRSVGKLDVDEMLSDRVSVVGTPAPSILPIQPQQVSTGGTLSVPLNAQGVFTIQDSQFVETAWSHHLVPGSCLEPALRQPTMPAWMGHINDLAYRMSAT